MFSFISKLFGIMPPPVVDWDVEGPPPEEYPSMKLSVFDDMTLQSKFTSSGFNSDGWWHFARKMPAHISRVGGKIIPRAAVVHTTDCYPGTAPVIAAAWQKAGKKRNGAHFIIGRDERFGVVQLVSVYRNGNHAGEADHGFFAPPGWDKPGGPKLIHPNTCAVGIELDGAGRLDRPKTPAGDPVHRDTGRTIPRKDCYWHKQTNTWWNVINEYQLTQLKALLTDLMTVFVDFPEGTEIVTRSQAKHSYLGNGVLWADPRGGRLPTHITGHVCLDPLQKTDPGPQVLGWVAENF